MNPFDTIIIIILGYCLIRSFFRGLIKEISSIIGVLGGFYAGYTYYPDITRPLNVWISNPAYAKILGFMLLFCGVFIFVSILGVIIKYLMNIAFLGWVDRICGVFFGVAKGILIASVLLMILTAFLPKGTPMIKDSLLAPHVTRVSEIMAQMVSKEMKQEFSTKILELKKIWNPPL
ncbi:MAG: CvpA family protein [Deltaproteobacteria bacterium]|nr:CvpA family protein [Deltaproteobacteria bacterium]